MLCCLLRNAGTQLGLSMEKWLIANVPIGLKINIALSYYIEYQNGANYWEPQGTWHTKSRDLAITKNCIQWNYVKVVMPG